MGGIYYLSMSSTLSNLPKISPVASQWLLMVGLGLVGGMLLGVCVFSVIHTPATLGTAAALKAAYATYDLDVADTDVLRERGLGGKDGLARNKGMVFVFDRPQAACFWMKDMRFSIDMVWLNEARRVIFIKTNVAPSTYPDSFCPPEAAKYVIELNAGEAKKQSIQTGDTLQLERLR